jgi:hypothetical protein
LLLSAVAPLGLSACAPIELVCKYPAPPPEVMAPLPAPGSFQDRLDAILADPSTASPAKRTK